MSRVLTVGTFDLFHPGHINFLMNCSIIAGSLIKRDEQHNVIVGLNTDEFVNDFKGKKPIYSYAERRAILTSCRYVYSVVKNETGADLKPLLEKQNPDILVVGSDWAKKDYYAQTGLNQDWLDFKRILLCYIPYTEGISSTQMRKRILGEST